MHKAVVFSLTPRSLLLVNLRSSPRTDSCWRHSNHPPKYFLFQHQLGVEMAIKMQTCTTALFPLVLRSFDEMYTLI